MGNKKALDEHWGARISRDAANLEKILEAETKSRGEPFLNLTKAADFGAKKLTEMSPEKRSPVSTSTLTRNETYRAVLERFIKTKKSKDLTASERLKFQLTLREKTQELDSLKKQLATALEDRSKAQHRLGQSVSHDASQKAIELSFGVWKKVVDRLLRELEGTKFDLQKRTIEDKYGSGTLLTEQDFPDGFFDWLERNKR